MIWIDDSLLDKKRFLSLFFKGQSFWKEVVVTSLSDPLVSPLVDVNIGLLLDAFEKILQFGVAPLVLVEVVFHSIAEVVLTDDGEETFEGGGTLGIGDSVENGSSSYCIVDDSTDWVGGSF